MLFDTHAHYDDKSFLADRDEIISSFTENGVKYAVTVGTNLKLSEKSIEIAEKHKNIYASVGIHPEFANECNDEAIEVLRKLSSHEKVVAIGEAGLDYHWEDNPPKEIQKDCFIKQIELANSLSLPIIIHNRDSTADMLDILKKHTPEKAIIHCVSVSPEIAKELIKMGFYISFAGTVTFKNANKLKEVAQIVPFDKLLIETDSPYLSPEPKRGKRNDSRNVFYVAKCLAEIKGVTQDYIEDITTRNAMDVYNIKE